MSHEMKCTWPSCSHTAQDQCRTDWVLRSEAHITARAADPDTITALRAENERLRAALMYAAKELELLYFFAVSNGIAEAGVPPHVKARAALEEKQ